VALHAIRRTVRLIHPGTIIVALKENLIISALKVAGFTGPSRVAVLVTAGESTKREEDDR
jgi:hypothetical protein